MSKLAEVTTYHRMTAKVNPDNPGFAGYFRRSAPPHIEVCAVISNGVKVWRERFKATSMEKAEAQIKEVIQFFNDTIRPEDKGREKERTFVGLYVEDEEVCRYADDRGMSGWLDPEGVFHPCGFGNHIRYALELAEKKSERFIAKGQKDMEDLAENQHIPMSVVEQSSGSFISILGKLTPPQIEWFNRFFFKLASVQRSELARVAKEQNVHLKFDW